MHKKCECPFCDCYFFSKHDLANHLEAHGRLADSRDCLPSVRYRSSHSKHNQKLSGFYYGLYPYDGYEEIKPRIFERDGYVCQICGKTIGDTNIVYGSQTKLSQIDFVVHHIDNNKKNQAVTNLQVVCSSCNRSIPQRRSWSKHAHQVRSDS